MNINIANIRQWVIIIYCSGAIILGAVSITYIYYPSPIMFIPWIFLFVLFLFIFFYKKKASNDYSSLFKQRDVSKLIKYNDRWYKIHRKLRKLRTKGFSQDAEIDLTVSLAKSIAFSMYGEFDKALVEINDHNTLAMADSHKAMKLNGMTINKFLQKSDLKNALINAEKALELISKLPKIFPGRETSLNSNQAYVEIGHILNKCSNDETIESLEKRFTKLDTTGFILKLLIAWALVINYKSKEDTTKEANMIQFIKTNAPYCKPLLNFNI
tara:strand:- start:6 stop:815 length:810 start_codon:yes stop_codon:yes gene_type:complete